MPGEIRSLDDVKAAALKSFYNSTKTIWEVLDEILDGMETNEIEAMYRSAGHSWCVDAIYRGGDQLVLAGIEQLAVELRQRRDVRNLDNHRIGGGGALVSRPRSGRRRSGGRRPRR